MHRAKRRAILASLGVLVVAAVAATALSASATQLASAADVDPLVAQAQRNLTICQDALNGGKLSAADAEAARTCVRINAEYLRLHGGSTPTPTALPTSPTPRTPAPTTSAPTTTPPPGGFPGPANTGVPAGTGLTPYTGPCIITTAGTVIDAKTINCALAIRTTGVVVKRSKLLGISGGAGSQFRVEDSTIDVSPTSTQGAQADGIAGDNFVALRVNVSGSNRGVYCHRNATIQDSWIHGTELNPTSNWHASALRVEQGCNIIHNTLACDWLNPTSAGGGCSADLTGYPDFAPIKDNLIRGNLFVANPTGAAFCAYGGATGGKPYSGDPTNATNIRFIDNVFQRGRNRNCAAYGPIDSFAVGRPGNQWFGNVWDDGGTVNP